MTTRERMLAVTVGSMFVVAAGYLGVRKMIIGKAQQYDADRVRLQGTLDKLQRDNAQVEAAAKSLRGWAGLTYDTDELAAGAKIGSALVALVERAGLSAEKLSLQPVKGGMVRGAYREIGRTIRVRGKLQSIVDFLYLLRQEPHLHRLDSINITPLPRTNEVDLQVRYMTLVLETKPSEGLKTDLLPTTQPTNLDSEERGLYSAIVSRDLFRPYIQRRQVASAPPPPPPPPTDPPRRSDPPRPPPPAPTARLRVVGLPDWKSQNEVLVSDSSTGQLRSYKAGDTLGGGTIVMVDYRCLPSPTNPKILSTSRAIFQVGPDYWAVELGQNLTDKRRLKLEELPEQLRSLPETAPGDPVKKNDPPER